MERFCGALGRAIHNRRFPYACLDKRVRDLAQLDQIKTLFNLWEELDLSNRRQVEKSGVRIPNCTFI